MTEANSTITDSYSFSQHQFPEATLILNAQYVITAVDKQTLTIFGWENEQELLDKDIFSFVLEEDKEKLKVALAKSVSDFYFNDLLFKFLKQDGSSIQVAGYASSFRNKSGNVEEIVIILHDVASLSSRIEQLQEAEQQFSEAQQIAHLGSWKWDIASNKFDCTEEMYRLLGINSQEPINNEILLSRVHPEDKEKVKLFIDNGLKEGSAKLDFRLDNGGKKEAFWLHGRNKTFYNDAHQPVHMVGTIHDVTHEKEIDTVKTQFLSLASHQMRGPLTTINWHAEMLLQQQQEGLTETQKKYIHELYNSSKRMVQLTNALLNVSALEMGTMPFKPENLSVEKIAKRVLEDYQTQIKEKNLSLIEEYGQNLPMIQTDLYLLKTIFHTFISNAVSYTPDGGKITLHVSLHPDRPQTFLISVTDTGFGIPKDQQDKVFTKLFRATNAKAKIMNGTGLDLYIVKLILKLNGGEISFVSEENKGSTFTIALPFVPTLVQKDDTKNA